MRKVITVTLNPSLDETVITSYINLGYYNHVSDTKHLDASGRGINVSRALSLLDVPTHSVIILGNDAIGHAYRSLVTREGFPCKIIQYEGPTRSDIIIVDQKRGDETHIVDEDSVGPRNDIQPLIDSLNEIMQMDDIVVLSGNLPHDTPTDIYARLIESVHHYGGHAVLMTQGEALQRSLKSAPETVVVTQTEFESLFNHPVRTVTDIKSSSSRLLDYGCKSVIAVMNDYSKALLVQGDDVWLTENPNIDFKGTHSGVIDAILAGYLAGLLKNVDTQEAFAYGMAALSFAAEKIGNKFGNDSEIRDYLPNIDVQPFNSNN